MSVLGIIDLITKIKAPIEIAVLVVIAWTMCKMYLMFIKWDKRFEVQAARFDGKFNVLTSTVTDHGKRLGTIETILLEGRVG